MDITLRIADGFAPNAEQIREEILSANFTDEVGPDGYNYTGICLDNQPDLTKEIAALVGFDVEIKLSCFRVSYEKEMPHNHVHSDGICAKYAGILYLNPNHQRRGGTAFWRHKVGGWDSLPADDELIKDGRDPVEFNLDMVEEWQRKDQWAMCGFAEMKFNRFITYPTKMFHSRYPHEAFGTTLSDGRLIWTVFYDRKGSQ